MLPTRLIVTVVLAFSLGFFCMFGWAHHEGPARLVIEAPLTSVPADGVSSADISVRSSDNRELNPTRLRIITTDKLFKSFLFRRLHGRELSLHAAPGVMPRSLRMQLSYPGLESVSLTINAIASNTDTFHDGTPDYLRLESPADQHAFRASFSALVEYQALRPMSEVPKEINDCAALLRFAYRSAIHTHDEAWAREHGPLLARFPEIAKYSYPNTPLAAGLFRTEAGAFRAGDERSAFSQFADVETLLRFNTFFISRDLRQAEPGDLLFFRQPEQKSVYHSMVFVGHGNFPGIAAGDAVVYHTGPTHGEPGEMRRLSVPELVNHPTPRWRPIPGNSNFLGVYRWNILREVD